MLPRDANGLQEVEQSTSGKKGEALLSPTLRPKLPGLKTTNLIARRLGITHVSDAQTQCLTSDIRRSVRRHKRPRFWNTLR